MTSRFSSLALALLGLSIAGCPEQSEGPVRDCATALLLPAGQPCDFSGLCGSVCPGMAVECWGRVTRRVVAQCDAGMLPVDAGSDAPMDDASASDAAASDAALDAGMCAPPAPEGVTPCRSNTDCNASTGERCVAPDERPGCGICMDPPRDCVSDPDCPSMDGVQYVCEEASVPCPCSGDGLGTYCVAPCSVTGCSEGFTCGASGHCAPIACDAGFACPLGTTCEPAGVGDPHGCVRDTCALDTDCPCGGGCVEGHCYDQLGACEPLRG
ncbi:MAG: hypothetical protein K1X94_36280 [Sandaracinaceae bacterium]|nr:hypothetical protein [Sandaracinaceae bacterium]